MRSCKLKKDRQYKGQTENGKITNNDHKISDKKLKPTNKSGMISCAPKGYAVPKSLPYCVGELYKYIINCVGIIIITYQME